MATIRIIILAIIQGATEFIPVSSSGHLVLVRKFFGWTDDGGLVLDVMLHAASLLALLVYYRKDWVKIFMSFLRRPDNETLYYRKLPFLLIAATIPVVIAAPFLHDFLENTVRNAKYVGVVMLVTAAWYVCCEIVKRQDRVKFGFPSAFFTGIIQIVALLPGASRSGWTAGAGLISGHSRNASVKFAFFMAIPAIAGAVVFHIRDILRGEFHGFSGLNVALGFVVCFAVSLGAIHFCVKFFRRRSFLIFAAYLATLGLIALIF